MRRATTGGRGRTGAGHDHDIAEHRRPFESEAGDIGRVDDPDVTRPPQHPRHRFVAQPDLQARDERRIRLAERLVDIVRVDDQLRAPGVAGHEHRLPEIARDDVVVAPCQQHFPHQATHAGGLAQPVQRGAACGVGEVLDPIVVPGPFDAEAGATLHHQRIDLRHLEERLAEVAAADGTTERSVANVCRREEQHFQELHSMRKSTARDAHQTQSEYHQK